MFIFVFILKTICCSLRSSRGSSKSGSLPRAWREQKLVTAVKVQEDETVAKRKALVEAKSPAELSQITSLSDIPLPAAFDNFLKSDKKAMKKDEVDELDGGDSQRG